MSQTIAGRTWIYDYTELDSSADSARLQAFVQSTSQQAARLVRSWSDDCNSEWAARTYLAGRMMLGASVLAQGIGHAGHTNLRLTVPYLRYYTMLTCLRAVILTSPLEDWNDGELFRATHSRTINVATSILRNVDMHIGETIETEARYLQKTRELFSYDLPSAGDQGVDQKADVLDYCRFCLEVSQLQSEVIEQAASKHLQRDYAVLPEYFDRIVAHDLYGVPHVDSEDIYRTGYLVRKMKRPVNVWVLLREGHVEDYFGAWVADPTNECSFDPDQDWRLLFDFQ